LGPLMCDIYASADVACSTASILLLAVISFDRYKNLMKKKVEELKTNLFFAQKCSFPADVSAKCESPT
jgi:hypothetical protein